jgi:para-aminobenzoate synthetase/4-amino-4-deoxychorismate lyase
VYLRFDFPDASGQPHPILFADPLDVIVARHVDEVLPVMRRVDAALDAGCYAAGFVSYEAAPGFDPALVTRPASRVPLLWIGIFGAPRPAGALAAHADSGCRATARADARAGGLDDDLPWTPDIPAAEHAWAVAAVKDAIERGDSYQANYTFRLRASVDPATLAARYYRLAHEQRARYGAYLDLGPCRVLSLSPELFFRRTGDRLVTQPMKGTARRGVTPAADVAAAAAPAASAKDRAEHVMIVDLARSDVGRVAEVGTVRAASLFDLERHPTVFQMVSTVEGRVPARTALSDIFTALFPAGSVTGAPKTSTMRLIANLEASPRGIYCGAVGYAAPNRDAVFNVAIRTMVVDVERGCAEYGIGGGITWDSTARAEYAEARSKAACLVPQPRFDLLETLRLDAGVYARLDRHLSRMAASAAYFDRPFDAGRVRAALEAHAAAHEGGRRRVRVRLQASGDVDVDSQPLDLVAAGPARVVLARTPIARGDQWLYHKTSHRAVYDRHRAAHREAFDVLLWNEDRELTEFTIGNLVVELDGRRVTPPVESGLLAGTFRGELLAAGAIAERVLKVDDLASASRLWLVNSVREWVEVVVDAPVRRARSRLAKAIE